MRICVFGAASPYIDEKYIQEVEELGENIGKRGHTLVFGAGANGLMGAAARGFKKGGGRIIGVIPKFFKEEDIEAIYEECDELFYTETMSERKMMMEDLADAFIIAPGGIGTFEEFFEVLTLKQLGRHRKPIILFDISGYYLGIQALMRAGTTEKFLRDDVMRLYKVFQAYDDENIIAYIEGGDDIEGLGVHDLKWG